MFAYQDQLSHDFRALIEKNNSCLAPTSSRSPLLPAPFSKLDRSITIVTKSPSNSGRPIDINDQFMLAKNGGGVSDQSSSNLKRKKSDGDSGKKIKLSKKSKGDDFGDGEGDENETDGEEEDEFDRAKKVKIKGFKDIGYAKYYRDLFSICWSNSPEGKKILGSAGQSKTFHPPDMHIQQTARSPYKLYGKDNWFGNLRVQFIEPLPSRKGGVKASSCDGTCVINLSLGMTTYKDLHELLTKRIQKSKKYDEAAKEHFAELVKLSELPIFKSAKYTLIEDMCKNKKSNKTEGAGAVGEGLVFDGSGAVSTLSSTEEDSAKKRLGDNSKYLKTDPVNETVMSLPKDFKSGISDFKLNVSAMEGGNRNKDLKDKVKVIYKYLWQEASKSKSRHKYFMKHVQPQYIRAIIPK